MVFGNLWMLVVGGSFVAVPILLHLIMQQKPKPMLFPAVRFLRETFASNQRRLKLKQWVLLLLRALVIVWLAAALAQPSVAAFLASEWIAGAALLLIALLLLGVFTALLLTQRPVNRLLAGVLAISFLLCLVGGGWTILAARHQSQNVVLAAGDGPVAAVFLIDTAPRMSLRQANQTRLERAQEIGDWLLKRLPTDSDVAVCSTGQPQIFFAVDLAAARQQLSTMETGFINRSMPARLAECLDLLEESDLPQQELYVFTDSSQQSWPEGPGLDRVLDRFRESSISLYIVDVAADTVENVSLLKPTLSREILAQQGMLEVEAEARLVGPARKCKIVMELEQPEPTRPVRRDGETLLPDRFWTRESMVSLAEGGSEKVEFQFPDLPPGVHHGVIRIESPDALDFDNRRFFTIQVRPAWRALVLTGPGVNSGILTQAIAPDGERQAGRALFDFVVRPQEQMTVEPIQEFDALFLLDPGPMEASAWELLAEYAREGGGLCVFLGPNAVQRSRPTLGVQSPESSFLSESAKRLLGGELTEVWRARDEGVWLEPSNLSHPILSPFRGRETSTPWRQFPVQRHWGFQVDVSPEGDAESIVSPAEVVMRFSDGMPAILQSKLGNGKVVVWTTPIIETEQDEKRIRWNSLTIGQCWPYFLLVNQLADELVSEPIASLNYLVAQPAAMPYRASEDPETLQLFPPRNEDPQKIRPVEGMWRVRFTETPGQYRLKGDRDGPVSLGFSANVADSESDLRKISKTSWDDWFGESGYQMASDAEEIVRQQGTTRRGQSFYPILMSLLPLLLGLEFLLGNRFYAGQTSSGRRGGVA